MSIDVFRVGFYVLKQQEVQVLININKLSYVQSESHDTFFTHRSGLKINVALKCYQIIKLIILIFIYCINLESGYNGENK